MALCLSWRGENLEIRYGEMRHDQIVPRPNRTTFRHGIEGPKPFAEVVGKH